MEKTLRNDSRFAHITTDPRFKRIPKSERKVKIDKRFQSMFNDDKFKLKYNLDKRGRPAAHTTTDDLRRYYELSDESEESESNESKSEEDQEEEKVIKKSNSKSANGKFIVTEESVSDDSESEEEQETKVKSKKLHSKSKKGKNLIAPFEPDSESNEEDGNEEEDDQDLGSDKEDKVVLSEEIKEKLRSNKIDYARGHGLLMTDSSSDEESSENESEADIREMDHGWGELDKDAERTHEITNRLAVCNMNWDRIRASDLMVLFSSFMPPGGVIHSVTIYPSEFGIERMKNDELAGPAELLADDPKVGDDFNDEGLPVDDANEEGDAFNMERLRQYQLSRLKYFYAVVVFDSPETANKVYSECDGTEYETSSAMLDLRFIPDDTTFDQEPKEKCESMPEPSKYVPLQFTTSALHQGKVQLTWDETDPYRVEASNRIAAGKANDEDLQAFIASSSGEEEEEEVYKEPSKAKEAAVKPRAEASIAKYRALLSGIEQEEKSKDQDVALEVSWGLNLKKKAEKLVKQKLKDGPDGLTPFQQMIVKKNEKKRKKREEKRIKKSGNAPEGEDNGAISDDDIPSDIDMNDPYFKEEMQEVSESKKKKEKKKKKKKQLEEEEDNEEAKKKKAELELLLMDSADDRQHFNLKQIIETEEAKSGKKKKKSKWKKNSKPIMEDNFEIDVKDDRFSALYSSHHFNIDPTDPRYRKTAAMKTLMTEKFKRKEAEERDGQQQQQVPAKKAKKSDNMDSDLTNLVKTLKKKTASKFKN